MQSNFFDLADRHALLEQLGDPLPKLNEVVDWEAFRPTVERIRAEKDARKGGRPPLDAVLMFKTLLLQQLYNLSDEQTEYQIRDRYSFSRFLNLTPEDQVPDSSTIWSYREQLKSHGLLEDLFAGLLSQIEAAGYIARCGQIVDAAIMETPRQRNPREENEQIKNGEVPEEWSDNKRRQKDTQARWARKAHQNYFGYKNHINVDVKHKVIRCYAVSDAALNDRRLLEEILDPGNTSRAVWADANYRSKNQEASLKKERYRSHIQRQGQANKPLNERQKATNKRRSKTRIRVEHIFAQQSWNGRLIRTIGLERARFKIGMMNLAYNVQRLAWLVQHVKPRHRMQPG
jgi:IS5 family transposase